MCRARRTRRIAAMLVTSLPRSMADRIVRSTSAAAARSARLRPRIARSSLTRWARSTRSRRYAACLRWSICRTLASLPATAWAMRLHPAFKPAGGWPLNQSASTAAGASLPRRKRMRCAFPGPRVEPFKGVGAKEMNKGILRTRRERAARRRVSSRRRVLNDPRLAPRLPARGDAPSFDELAHTALANTSSHAAVSNRAVNTRLACQRPRPGPPLGAESSASLARLR